MRQRALLLVLLGSALTFLASLYLPWRSAQGNPSFEGWNAIDGYAAALLAIALAGAAAVALLRPALAARLPLGGLGVGVAYFTPAVALELQAQSRLGVAIPPGIGWTGYAPFFHYAWSYGVFVGGASGGLAGLVAIGVRGRELFRRRTFFETGGALLGLGLLVSFLLPWISTGPHVAIAGIGLDTAAATLAAWCIFLCAGRWLRAAHAPTRLGGAAAAAVLTGAAATGIGLAGTDAYGAWIGIGCVLALVLLEAARTPMPVRLLEASLRRPTLRIGAALLLLVAVFLPWQEYVLQQGNPSFTSNGWQTLFGAVAGVLALLLLAGPVLPWVESYALEATLGIAILVATPGVLVAVNQHALIRLRYGVYLAFAAAALLLLAAFRDVRPARLAARRVLACAPPVVASAACVAAVVLPLWEGVLPFSWLLQASAVHDWFTMAALLLTLHVLRLWLARIGRSTPGRNLVLGPLAVVPLPALDLIRYRDLLILWGGVILVGLCLLLAVLAGIERLGGVRRMRLPELLRVDRLPEVES